MKTTVKIFSLLALTLAVSEDMIQEGDDRVSWRAKCVQKSAKAVTAKYPNKLGKSQLKQINQAVNESDFFGPGKKNLVILISFLLCGFDEILQHTSNNITKKTFSDIVVKSKWLMELFDSKLDRTADYIRAEHKYLRWTNE